MGRPSGKHKMIGGSLLSLLPQGLFNFALDGGVCGKMSKVLADDEVRKRRRDVGGSRTPRLVVSPTGFSCGRVRDNDNSDNSDRPRKRFRGQSKIDDFVSPSSSSSLPSSSSPCTGTAKATVACNIPRTQYQELKKKQTSDLIKKLPGDVVAHCLSFLGSTEDRHALQNTCKLFREISNSDYMLSNVDVFGDLETGKGGIIQENDTPATAAAALAPFARAGNLQALYMLGIVKCYCFQDLKNGILILKMASSRGYVRSSYTLGIILRDALLEDASQFMNIAASKGYLPALQEILPAREMKERFGEPNADELRKHLDPVGLNRLLLRDYVNSAELRGMNTSHCWNPLCGKWAHKASSSANNNNNTSSNHPSLRMRRSSNASTVQPTYDVDENMLDPSPSYNNEGTVSPRRGEEIRGAFGTFNNNNNIDLNNRLHRRPHHHPSHSAADGIWNRFSKGCRGSWSSTKVAQALAWNANGVEVDRVARMKMCSRCCRAKYCSKLCQVYDWRSSQHKMECQFL